MSEGFGGRPWEDSPTAREETESVRKAQTASVHTGVHSAIHSAVHTGVHSAVYTAFHPSVHPTVRRREA